MDPVWFGAVLAALVVLTAQTAQNLLLALMLAVRAEVMAAEWEGAEVSTAAMRLSMELAVAVAERTPQALWAAPATRALSISCCPRMCSLLQDEEDEI